MSGLLLNAPIALDALGWDAVARLGGATAAGLLLGVDREVRGHGPGLRTHAIICFSTALLTVASIALYLQLGGPEARLDPLRVIEGTAAMVGVMAGALIVFSKGEVKNLTTAAHLWLAAAIGITFGAGQYPLALMGIGVAVVLLTVLRAVEQRAPERDDG
ncbi:MgtC/SapB family protein [Sphingomonas sp. IW22]|uniref:MgtC/SapB family protein n=1 Tax=Sphingomonas sp. IW22 TaxID=3242489 RepID=UPI0035220242